MLKCLECGGEFDEPRDRREYRGEHFGFPAYETVYVCPYCGGDYEEIDERVGEDYADI